MNTHKLIFSTLLCCCCMISTAVAQLKEGIQFFEGSWAELIVAAKKQNKPIFVDVYTDWCPPCKRMDKEIFPLKEVGNKYNTAFINYRLDAEKGEGIKLAKNYGVKAYPTYLYLDEQGNLVHRALDFMPAASFVSHADKAISMFSGTNNISQLEKEFKAGNRKSDFLKAYLIKMKELGLDNSEILNAYFKIGSVKELATPKELMFVAEQMNSIKANGFIFLMENFEVLDLQQKRKLADQLYKNILYTSFSLAYRESRPLEIKQIISYTDQLKPYVSAKNLEGIHRLELYYYTMVKDAEKLKKVSYLLLGNKMDISLEAIHAEDVKMYKELMKPYWSGQLDSTKLEGFQEEKKYMVSQYSAQISSRLYDLAEALVTTLDADDPALKDALLWIRKAEAINPGNKAIIALEAKTRAITGR